MQGAAGYNIAAKLDSTNKKTTAEGLIDLAGYSAQMIGAKTTNDFYNIKVDRRSSDRTALAELEDVLTGTISVKGSRAESTPTNAIGIYAGRDAYNAYATAYASKKAVITGNMSVRGFTAVGIQSSGNAYNAYSDSSSFVSGKGVFGNITVLGARETAGIKASGYIYNARGKGATGSIVVVKQENNEYNAYGIYGTADTIVYNEKDTGATDTTTSTAATVKVTSIGRGNAYGIYGKEVYTGFASKIEVYGNPLIASGTPTAVGKYYGIYATSKAEVKKGSSILVEMRYPMYSSATTLTTNNTEAYGIYAKAGATVVNAGRIEVKGSNTSTIDKVIDSGSWTYTSTGNQTGTAYGIYAEGNGGRITNSGTITISGVNYRYGIYVKNGTNTTVDNTGGTISVGTCPSGGHCEAIHLGGATFVNNSSYTSEDAIDFDAIDGTMSVGRGGTYEAPSLSGQLFVDSNSVEGGFDDTYTLENALKTEDSSQVNVASKSALFVASKADNGTDIMMNRQSFSLFSDNDSVVSFLNKNYASKKNEKLFNALKQIGSATSLRKAMYTLSGQKLFGQLNFNDMAMMRELNARMNQTLFDKNMTSFNLTEEPKSMLFKGASTSNVQYGLMNKKMGNKSIGLGIAVSQVIDTEGEGHDNHQQTTYQMIVPFGYQIHGLKVVTAPRLGYARGSYDRMGLNNTTYEGTIEKRVYGVTNEIRYPIELDDWQFAPALEFNMLGYQQRGREKDKDFSLRIPNQHTLSVESGVGFYASQTKQMKDGTLNLNAGVAFYHEFADPYTMRLQMNGMQGDFRVTDDKHGANRTVLKAGFDYQTEKMDVYGDFISELSQGVNALTKTGIRVRF